MSIEINTSAHDRSLTDRRAFILTGLAALGAAAMPQLAQAQVQLPEAFMPRIVPVRAEIAPSELHLVPGDFALYWTLGQGEAIRYAVGVGRPGLYESGTFFVGAKKEWPSWTPTPDMIRREPQNYAQYADGMPGGVNNPLGARALYLFTPERGDTYLRIHGTNQPGTIGTAVSNGCARLTNEHIMDLYERVPMGARVVLY